MLEKLGEIAKSPTTSVTLIALILVLALATIVSEGINNAYAQAKDNGAALALMQHDLIEHRSAEVRNSSLILEAIEDLMREERAANAAHTRLLQGICYYNANNQAQRDWCMSVK